MGGVEERTLKESSAWNHMTSVVGHIVAERPANAIDVLESVSTYINTGKPVPSQQSSAYQDTRPKAKQLINPETMTDTTWAAKFGTHLVPPKPQRKPGEEEEEPEAAEEEDKGELPDIMTEQSVFNAFGEGIGEIDSYRITVALKRLLDKEPLAKVRFWGKILGTKRDYYICEGKIDEARVPEKETAEEEAQEQVGKPLETIYQGLNTYRAKAAARIAAEEGKGVNENRYYVATSDDLTHWVALSDVLPAHIIAARKIHKLFTGNLDATVECHPPFPGLERHYLRAQIARISHTTTVCPKDMWTTEAQEEEEGEDGEPIKKRFEVKPYEDVPPLNAQEAPDAEDPEAVAPLKMWFHGFKHGELLEVKNWVHTAPQMLTQGRATLYKPEEEEPADEEEEDGSAPQHVEWIHPFLSDLSHDRSLSFDGHSKSAFPAWTVRMGYHNESDVTRMYLARSLLWPGALCSAVCEDNKPGAVVQNLYVGYGVKNLCGRVYAPPLPPMQCAEFPCQAKLMKDCTRDDELEFEPAPAAPVIKEEGEEGEEAED